MNCQYEHDDGAYVLGALAPAERAAYERHLSDCRGCRQSVAETAVLPGLLGRLSTADLNGLETPAQQSRLPSLLAAASAERRRRRHHRRRRTLYAAAALAAWLVFLLGAGMRWLGGVDAAQQPGVNLVAMAPLRSGVPVSAEVGMRNRSWGTEVTMHCAFVVSGDRADAHTYWLVAHGADDVSETVGSWIVGPGDDITFTGMTRFSGAELRRLEIVAADGAPVLAHDVT